MKRRIISVPILRLFLLLSPIVLVLPIRRTRCRPRVSLCSLMVSVDTVSMSGRRRVLEGGIRREVGRLAEVLEFRRPYLHLGILDLFVRRRVVSEVNLGQSASEGERRGGKSGKVGWKFWRVGK